MNISSISTGSVRARLGGSKRGRAVRCFHIPTFCFGLHLSNLKLGHPTVIMRSRPGDARRDEA